VGGGVTIVLDGVAERRRNKFQAGEKRNGISEELRTGRKEPQRGWQVERVGQQTIEENAREKTLNNNGRSYMEKGGRGIGNT